MMYIGLDPGVSGGIAVVDELGLAVGLPVKLAMLTDLDILDTLMGIAKAHWQQGCRAVIEKAQATPQMGVVSAFTYGRGYGALRMALLAAGIPFDEVTSPVWQPVMSCRSRGDKNITKRRAQQLFPRVTITHAIADALLLAEYCRRTNRAYGQTNQAERGRRHGEEEGTGEEVRGRRAPARRRTGQAQDGTEAEAGTAARQHPAAADPGRSITARHGEPADRPTGRDLPFDRGRAVTDQRPEGGRSRLRADGARADAPAPQDDLAGARRGVGAGAGRGKAAGADHARRRRHG